MNFAVLAMYALGVLAALLLGNAEAAGAAVLEGAASAVRFAVELTGAVCLWSAVTELLEQSGAAAGLSRLLRPLLRRLFPQGARDGETLEALTENLGANLLGLGNAATPAGIRAARGLARLHARRELDMLVVLNTASLQLLPTAAASLRASLGSRAPFDITPAVWLSSTISVLAGLLALRLLRR